MSWAVSKFPRSSEPRSAFCRRPERLRQTFPKFRRRRTSAADWYLRGVHRHDQPALRWSDQRAFDDGAPTSSWLDSGNFDAVPLFGLGIGFQHNEHLRFDAHRRISRQVGCSSALDHCDSAGTRLTTAPTRYTGKKSELTFLANAYWDFGTWSTASRRTSAPASARRTTRSTDFTDINTSIAGGAGWAPTGRSGASPGRSMRAPPCRSTTTLSLDLGYSYHRPRRCADRAVPERRSDDCLRRAPATPATR